MEQREEAQLQAVRTHASLLLTGTPTGSVPPLTSLSHPDHTLKGAQTSPCIRLASSLALSDP